MKRYIKAMGVENPAHMKEPTAAINSTIPSSIFKKVVNVASKTNNTKLIDGLIQLVIDDIEADLTNTDDTKVDSDRLYRHYKPYYLALRSVKYASNGLLGNLDNLIKNISNQNDNKN